MLRNKFWNIIAGILGEYEEILRVILGFELDLQYG